MRQDCIAVVSACGICQRERSKPLTPGYLQPTAKPLGLFAGWSVDLITNLPRGPDGETHAAVMVDCWSKWVEIVPLKDRSSATLARTFLLNILAHYGKCAFVHSD